MDAATTHGAETGPGKRREGRAERALAVVARVRGVAEARRTAAIDAACGDDLSLHARVTALLTLEEHPSLDLRPGDAREGEAHQGAASGPAASSSAPPPTPPAFSPAEAPQVPGFRIVGLLGTGATSRVYEAEQERPRRRVALKVFAGRRADGGLSARIGHEAEVLARLHHPSIAQVYAADEAPGVGGRAPWIAMELVRGLRIDEWCREHRSTLRERVELLATVAQAVAHAHASGVVHRDLKPSNVLVTEAGVPKVVDFGLAKTLDDVRADAFEVTREGDVVGTLAYMAVEQAQGQTSLVDTRTDVHALGVIAFQLLAGRLPRDPLGKSLPVWALELGGPAPSLRAAAPAVPLDLALVVGKALEGERERRYPTAQAFADDLGRWLAGEPVQARAPTTGYLLRAFVRRHRALVAGVLATVVALAVGLVVSLRFALDSREQRRRADLESREALREAYRARTAAAGAALAGGNACDARAALDAAAPEFRGWEWRYLDAQVERSTRVVRHPVPLAGFLALAHEGPLLVGGDAGGGCAVIDTERGTVVARVGGTPRVERAALVADGRRLVVAREGGGLEVHDLVTGAARALPSPPGRALRCDALVTSHAGALVAESRSEAPARLRVIDLDTGAEHRPDVPQGWPWTSLDFDAADARLVASSADGRVLVIDARGSAPCRLVATHPSLVLGSVFDRDGRHVYSGGDDRRLLRIDLGGEAGLSEVVALHRQGITGLAADAEGQRVATWARDRLLRVFDAADGRLLAAMPSLALESGALLRFAPGARALEAFDHVARHVWFTATDTDFDVLRGHRGPAEGNPHPYVYDVAYSPDGRRLATAGWDGSVRIWSAVTCRALAVLETGGAVQALAWSPDGRRVATCGRTHRLTLYDATTGRRLATVDDGPGDMLGGLAFAADGSALLGVDGGRKPVLRDPRTLVVRRRVEVEEDALTGAAAAPDGFVLGLGRGTWQSWDLGLERLRATHPPHTAAVRGVAVARDGALIAAASDDGSVSVVEAKTGALRARLTGHVGAVFAVAFSPDGTRLATGGDDGTIRLHDTATGEEVLVLRGHGSYVYALDVSPDGTTIASASGDGTARLWSSRSLAERTAARDAALALEAAVAPLVSAALAAAPDADAAVARVAALPDLTPAQRLAAADVLLRLLAAR